MKKISLLLAFVFLFLVPQNIYAAGLCQRADFNCDSGLKTSKVTGEWYDLCVPELFVSGNENGVCFDDENCPGELKCTVDTNPYRDWCSPYQDLYTADPSNTTYWPPGRCVSITDTEYSPTYNCANRGTQCDGFDNSCKDDASAISCITNSFDTAIYERCWIHPSENGTGFIDGSTSPNNLRGSCATKIIETEYSSPCGGARQRCCLDESMSSSADMADFYCNQGIPINVAGGGLTDCRCCVNGECYEEESPEYNLCEQISNNDLYDDCQTCFDNDGVWTAIGCVPTDPVEMIGVFINVGISIGGGVAMLSMIVAGFLYTSSKGDPQKTGQAKELMTSAVIGLLFVIFSITILQFIAGDLIRLPGFANETNVTQSTNRGTLP